MKQINGFDKIQETSNFHRLPIGAYVCKIMNVEDVPEKEYLKIYFDVAEGDKKGYFSAQYKTDTREDKRWPNAGSFIRSYKEAALSMFKGFTNALEKSNKNYTWDFNEKGLVGKQICLIIGDEEYLNQKGQKRVRNYVQAVRSVEAFKNGDFTLPEMKKLDTTRATTAAPAPVVDPFADVEPPKQETSNPFADASNPFDADSPWA